MPATSLPTALSTPFFVPVPFAHPALGVQEPKTAPDTPTGAGPVGPGAQPNAGAQVPGQPGQAQPPCMDSTMLLYGVGFLALMYFMVLGPDKKRRKQQQELLASVKVGDHIVTLGGMHGTVASLADKTVTLRVDSVKITIDRTAIGRVERGDAAAGGSAS